MFMGIDFFKFNFHRALLFFIGLILLSSPKLSAQVSPNTDSPVNNPSNQSTQKRINASEKYKYIVGQSPDELKNLLDEWGAKKYKLLIAAKIPLRNKEQSYKQMII